MKNLALITLLCTLNPTLTFAKTGDKIIGGTKSQGHNFFLQLSMDGTLNTAFCGSTAIAPGVAVTAAHCVASKTRKFKLIAGLKQDGVNNLKVIDVHAVISHQQYAGTMNDIALVFFDQTQADGAVIPAPINRGQVVLNDETTLKAIGRGNMTSIGTLYGSDLFEVDLPYIDNASCQAVEEYKGAITNKHECAGEALGGKDSCQGDSGGPLVAMIGAKATLIGVTNFGLGCGQKGLPGVYASLKGHASWIDSNIERYNNNENFAAPSMDYAFASKCYLMDAPEEILQQQNTNDSGIMSMTNLYLPSTRFMTSSQSMTSAAKSICDFKIKDKSYKVMADKSLNKIFIKDQNSSAQWVAKLKRKTDSIYQRCVQTAPMAISFDIAVGDGSGMININNNMGRLTQFDGASMPADAASVGGCTIDKYETILATSQSTQSILVTLKNHIDDTTTYFYMGGPSAGPANANKGKLSASLDVGVSTSATLTLNNESEEDLFSWEIKCNKDFSAFNKNKRDSRTIRYLAGTDAKGTVLEGEKLDIIINFSSANPNADGKLECTVNRDLKVSVN
tara:strand:- start:48254 stop:49945 length:1692 start_codon:yes stop_codon:yes gene_type:complete